MKTVIIEKIRYKNGSTFTAHFDDFINIHESPVGFGSTPEEAKENLYAKSEADHE